MTKRLRQSLNLLLICCLLLTLIPVHAFAAAPEQESATLNVRQRAELGLLEREGMPTPAERDRSLPAPASASITPSQSVSPPAAIRDIFPDPRVALAVSWQLGGLDVDQIVTQNDLDQIQFFHISPYVASLEGIQYLRQLGYFHAWDAPYLSDISPLSELAHLHSLWIFEAPIHDLSPLSELTSLTQLVLYGFLDTDLSPLSGLTNLDFLALSENQVSDISPLSGLVNLTYLEFWDTHVSDLRPISGLVNLSTLHVDHSRITDFSPLSGLYTQNTQLGVSGLNQETTLAPTFRTEVISVPNMVRAPSGIFIPPNWISDGGVYANGRITWSGLTNQEYLSFSWEYWGSSHYFWGYGTVTIPLREGSDRSNLIQINHLISCRMFEFPSRAAGEANRFLVSVKNVGNTSPGTLVMWLEGTNASSFEFTHAPCPTHGRDGIFRPLSNSVRLFLLPNLEPGSPKMEFVLRPRQNLAPGIHTATVRVSGGGGISDSFDVVFEVQ